MQIPNGVADALELFQIMAHPMRLRLLMELCREEECVCHLAALLDRPQPYVSQQLAELRQAGLIIDRRDGQRIFYRIVDPRVKVLFSAAELCAGEQRSLVSRCPCAKCA